MIFEVNEYIICVQEYLEDEQDDLTTPLEQILLYLKPLRHNVSSKMHTFSNGANLDYRPLIRKLRHVLPFYALLNGLNNAHHRGINS